jgi:hypothetical protein
MENIAKQAPQETLTYEAIKVKFPDEWIVLGISDAEQATTRTGVVLLHGKDYLELCYKASAITKNQLTTIFFTGEQQKYRKWMKLSRSSEHLKTT